MLLPPVTLSLSESGIRIHLHGGSAKDKDALYNFIARWPGWMRHPSNGMDGAYSGPMSPYTCLLLTKLIGQTQVHYQNEETKNAIHQSVERLHQAEAALKCTQDAHTIYKKGVDKLRARRFAVLQVVRIAYKYPVSKIVMVFLYLNIID